jgi:nicotinamidase-related amidase
MAMQRTAVIVTDMLNRYDHEDGEALRASVRRITDRLRGLLDPARKLEVLTVYVNDNHGDWSARRAELIERAMAGRDPRLVQSIAPADDLPFIVKARHSAFHETQLDYLLQHQEIDRLVIAGQVTEQCILYSALDAYVRHYEVVIPTDAVAAIPRERGAADDAAQHASDHLPRSRCIRLRPRHWRARVGHRLQRVATPQRHQPPATCTPPKRKELYGPRNPQ